MQRNASETRKEADKKRKFDDMRKGDDTSSSSNLALHKELAKSSPTPDSSTGRSLAEQAASRAASKALDSNRTTPVPSRSKETSSTNQPEDRPSDKEQEERVSPPPKKKARREEPREEKARAKEKELQGEEAQVKEKEPKPWETFRQELGPTLLAKGDFTDEQKRVIQDHGGLSTKDGVWKHISDQVWGDEQYSHLGNKERGEKLKLLYDKFDAMLNKGSGS